MLFSFYLQLISVYDAMMFVVTFTGNVRLMFSVTAQAISHHKGINEIHGKERGGEIWTGMRWGRG